MKGIGVVKSGTAKSSYGDAANGSTTRRNSSVSYSDARQWQGSDSGGLEEQRAAMERHGGAMELRSNARQWRGVD